MWLETMEYLSRTVGRQALCYRGASGGGARNVQTPSARSGQLVSVVASTETVRGQEHRGKAGPAGSGSVVRVRGRCRDDSLDRLASNAQGRAQRMRGCGDGGRRARFEIGGRYHIKLEKGLPVLKCSACWLAAQVRLQSMAAAAARSGMQPSTAGMSQRSKRCWSRAPRPLLQLQTEHCQSIGRPAKGTWRQRGSCCRQRQLQQQL